jgi:phage gpG-like protein
MPTYPRPGMGSIVAAVSGARAHPFLSRGGLVIQIDPGQLFASGLMANAKRIDRLGMSFSSFKEPLRDALNQVVVPSIFKNFAAQGRPAWKKLAKSTVQSRLRQGFARGPILQRTGRLRKMATRKNIWEIRPASGSTGADLLRLRANYFTQLVPYAPLHQAGASAYMRKVGFYNIGIDFTTGREIATTHEDERYDWKLPARPFIQLTVDEEVMVYNIFVAFMVEKVNKHWGK